MCKKQKLTLEDGVKIHELLRRDLTTKARPVPDLRALTCTARSQAPGC